MSTGTLSLEAAGAISASAVTVNGIGTLLESTNNALSGTAALTVNGASSSVTLTNANNYTGPTSVQNGTLALTAAGAISGSSVTFSGGTLTQSLDNALSGSTSLVVNTPGNSLALSNNNNYSGSTSVTGGTLNLVGALTSSTAITVDASTNSANLVLTGANALASGANVTGLGTSTFPTVTANASQSFASLNSTGTTTFTAGSSTVGTIDGNGSLSVTGASLTANHIRHATVNVNAGSTVSIAASANPGNTNATSYAASLSIDSAGTLDINNNSLVVEYGGGSSPLTSVQAAITQAFDSNAWDQSGLTSTSARNHSSQYGIGIAEASVLAASQGFGSITTFEGVNFASGNAVVVKYTLRGDTTLRGSVGLQDFNKVVSNFNTAQNWSGGNFDNSGLVGLGDYNNVVSNFNLTATGSAAPANFVGPTLAGGAVTHAAPGGGGTASASGASSDLRLEVNTITGHVSLLAMTNVNFTGYNIADPSKNLLAGTSGVTEQLISQHASNKVNWSVIKDDSTTLAEGENLSKYKATKSSTWDTIQLTAGQTIDFGVIFNTTANVKDLTFQFSEANTTTGDPTTGQTFSVGASGVDYTPVPEPTTVSMLAVGAMGLLGRRRRRLVKKES